MALSSWLGPKVIVPEYISAYGLVSGPTVIPHTLHLMSGKSPILLPLKPYPKFGDVASHDSSGALSSTQTLCICKGWQVVPAGTFSQPVTG